MDQYKITLGICRFYIKDSPRQAVKSKDPAAEKNEAARNSFGAGGWNLVCLVHGWVPGS